MSHPLAAFVCIISGWKLMISRNKRRRHLERANKGGTKKRRINPSLGVGDEEIRRILRNCE